MRTKKKKNTKPNKKRTEPHKVSLRDMLSRLQEIENYGNPEYAFNALLYGWRVRRGYTTEWLCSVRKKDLIQVMLAEDFARYCLQNKWRKMMPD